MEKLVTVVIPIYNVEKYLDRCINSVVNQTYKNLEIILVDDGSPDNCPQMCDAWAQKDSRVKVIHKENAGLGMARNTGIDNATGEYICFFDSDDYIAENLIEKCISYTQDNSTDLVWFGYVDFYDDHIDDYSDNSSLANKYLTHKSIVEDLLPELINHDYSESFSHGYTFSAWSALFSLSFIEEHKLRFCSEREIISEDTYFLLQFFSKANKVVVLDDILYFRYRNAVSLTTIYRDDRQEKINHFFNETVKLIKDSQLPDEILTRVCMLYHSFTIAALKMIVHSTLSNKRKYQEIRGVLCDSLFQGTLKNTVLKKEKKSLKIFFTLARRKMFYLCYLILKAKKD